MRGYPELVDPTALTSAAANGLAAQADTAKATKMAAYMKTEMPFYGVPAPGVRAIVRDIVGQFPASTHAEYDGAVRALWSQPHREEKYLAISYARRFPEYITMGSVDLYQTMIAEGAWWDFVDAVASHLIGQVLMKERQEMTPVVRGWITDDDVWLRRTSIICQLRHKGNTDTLFLSDACLANARDADFFIRKGIGWALREYAKSDPVWVAEFVAAHRGTMSGLSIREATKHL